MTQSQRHMTGGYLIEMLPAPFSKGNVYRLWVSNPTTLEERCVMAEAAPHMPNLGEWVHWHDRCLDGRVPPSRIYFDSGRCSLRKICPGFAPPTAALKGVI